MPTVANPQFSTPPETFETLDEYTHPEGDGFLHVPATGTENGGKVLTAGAEPGSLSWARVDGSAAPEFEDLSSQIDGVKTHFLLSNSSGTIDLFINGLRQRHSYPLMDTDNKGFSIDDVLIPGDCLEVIRYGAGSTPGLASPMDIADCILLLDETGLAYANSESVPTWMDHTAFGNHAVQATAYRQPEYVTGMVNGLPVVRFDAVDDSLSIPINLSSTPYSIAVVYAISGANPLDQRTVNGDASNWLIGTYTSTTLYNGSFVQGAAPIPGNFMAVVVRNHTLRVNGVEIGTSSSAGTPGNLFLGQNDIYPNSGACDIACVVVYSRSLSDSELETLEAFLINKYNL